LINKIKNVSFSDIKKIKCYELFQNLDHPCDFCTNKIIQKNSGEPYRWQYYNPFLGMHFLITDKLLVWGDGTTARFEIAIDITEEINIKQKLEQTIKN
jgi:hypothetical protein